MLYSSPAVLTITWNSTPKSGSFTIDHGLLFTASLETYFKLFNNRNTRNCRTWSCWAAHRLSTVEKLSFCHRNILSDKWTVSSFTSVKIMSEALLQDTPVQSNIPPKILFLFTSQLNYNEKRRLSSFVQRCHFFSFHVPSFNQLSLCSIVFSACVLCSVSLTLCLVALS